MLKIKTFLENVDIFVTSVGCGRQTIDVKYTTPSALFNCIWGYFYIHLLLFSTKFTCVIYNFWINM